MSALNEAIFNSLGYVIGNEHVEPMMLEARSASGIVVSIADVRRGLSSNCVCLCCGGLLVARQGDYRAWHFAHVSDQVCSYGETRAHRFAKDVIEQHRSLWLPSTTRWGQLGDQIVGFDHVDIEQQFGNMRPDLICRLKGRTLLVEIKVSNACSIAKRALIADSDVSAIEIDLSKFRYKADEEIASAVINGTNRWWIYRRGNRYCPVKPKKLRGDEVRVGPPLGICNDVWETMDTLARVEAKWPAHSERDRLRSKYGKSRPLR